MSKGLTKFLMIFCPIVGGALTLLSNYVTEKDIENTVNETIDKRLSEINEEAEEA